MNNASRPALVVALVMLLVIAAIAAGYFWWVQQQDRQPPADTGGAEYQSKLIACYPNGKMIANDSIQQIQETSRVFINFPRDLYPDPETDNHFLFQTVQGDATAGWISNAGPRGEALEATPQCWSYYYEFNGSGEVDLRIKSSQSGVPDYFVRFVVGSAASSTAP